MSLRIAMDIRIQHIQFQKFRIGSQAYNAEIYAEGQSGLKDPFAYETPAFDLTAYGLPDDMIAALWVPRLDLDLPVYLGASTENMARGGALLGQTSMPLGGANTNTVIAAHRGYYGAEMLRNVQQIQIGDKITLTTPWETLTYRVCELKIIQPDDINAILIQPGRDLLTLTTCHPYTQNTQRYLVIAERDPGVAPVTHEEDLAECAGSWDAAPRQVTVESPDGTAAVEEIEPESISPLPNEGSGEDAGGAYSNWMIWLENNALWAGIVLIAAGMMLVCAVLFLPALALRPVLALPLDALQPVTERARVAALGAAIEWLPKISGGALNFHVSAAAGGVEDGSLTQSDGLALQGLEDLLVTTDEKPTETVYLRGFIGAEYDGHSWQPADAEQFDNAAASWKTDGDSRLAIANLPFLRAAYDGAAPQQMTVQRLHADDTYTFVPYNAYFNDYYRLNGDGAAAGQTAQDDTFYYFPRREAKTLLTARADADPSVLDRLESAYAAYAESRYLATPDGADYGTLQEFCNAAEKEHKLTGDADAIRTFVRSYLNEHCTYTSDPPQPADGADPVLYFLNESHAGSSTQFASAAVVLCRMLGLPARYVVGYAAPQSLFAESDGGWQAVLQDDNAHAWAEVYLAGQGWTPLETTPGMVSELTEDQLAANANAVPTADDTETPLPAATPAPEADPTTLQARAFWWLLPLAAVLAALAVWGIARARRTPADTVRAEFRALYKKMCRCGLSEGVSSDQEEFKQFLREHTKTAAPQDVETLLALVQTAQFAPGPVSAQTAQQVRGLCRILRKNLHR